MVFIPCYRPLILYLAFTWILIFFLFILWCFPNNVFGGEALLFSFYLYGRLLNILFPTTPPLYPRLSLLSCVLLPFYFTYLLYEASSYHIRAYASFLGILSLVRGVPDKTSSHLFDISSISPVGFLWFGTYFRTIIKPWADQIIWQTLKGWLS